MGKTKEKCGTEKESPTEKIAKLILKELFPDTEVRLYDDGKKNNAHDYNLINLQNNSLLAAVEVTSSVRPDAKKLKNLISRNHVLEARKVKRFWLIYLSKDFIHLKSTRKQWKKFDDYLAKVEEEGIAKFDYYHHSLESKAVKNICGDLKIDAGFSRTTKKPKIVLTDAGDGGEICSSYIQGVVEREAFKKDNRGKLSKARAKWKFLFIIIDCETNYMAWRTMLDGKVPNQAPHIPTEIDTIWLATWSPSGNYLVWHVIPPNNWEIIGEIEINC